VQRKIAGSDSGTKIIESIQAYKDIVKDSKDGQEAVGFEQCSCSTTNAIFQLLLFWVCVWCDEIYI
jgi:hypothetical protein